MFPEYLYKIGCFSVKVAANGSLSNNHFETLPGYDGFPGNTGFSIAENDGDNQKLLQEKIRKPLTNTREKEHLRRIIV